MTGKDQPRGEPRSARHQLRRVLLLVQVVGFVVSIGLLGLVIVRGARGVDVGRLRLAPAAGAVVLAAVSWLGFARAWAALLGGPHTVGAMHNWTRSQLLRYLPGGVFAPLARAGTVPGRLRLRVSAVVVEAVVIGAVAGGVAGVLAGASADRRWLLLVPAAGVLLVASAWMAPRVGIPASRIWAATRWLLPGWVAYALAGVLAQRAVGPVDSWGLVAGASLLAWCAGYYFVFAPGGAGARELAYVALLVGHYSEDVAAAGALAGRLVLTLGEIIVVAALAGLAHRLRLTRRTGDPAAGEPHQ
jgi:hypothetical protein